MKKKKIKYPIHKMGNKYGYKEHEDGSISIAPIYADKMEKALVKNRTIRELLNDTISHCAKLKEESVKEISEFWESVAKDYNLDFDKYTWHFDIYEKKLMRRLKEQPKQTEVKGE